MYRGNISRQQQGGGGGYNSGRGGGGGQQAQRSPQQGGSNREAPKWDGDGRHTVILQQPTANPGSRTYLQESTVGAAMEGILAIFETALRQRSQNSGQQEATYDTADLLEWADSLYDLTALVYEPEVDAYVAFPRSWVKDRLSLQVRRYMR